MNSTDFTWGDEIIDSRDIIARHEELTEEYDSLVESLAEAKANVSRMSEHCDTFNEENTQIFEQLQEEVTVAQSALAMFNTSEKDELDLLTNVIEQGETSPDWSYGETLIHEDYFTRYIEELVNDCYEFPKEIHENKWPWTHMSMDWEGAAEEAKMDYTTIEAGGETYYIRG